MFDFLGDLLGLNAGKATQRAAWDNKEVIGGLDKRGSAAIDEGSAAAGGYLKQVAGLYDPIKGSTGLYADAVGLNGADGSGRAKTAFTESPGYNFSRDQALQAIDRRASSMGDYQSGGTMTDVIDYTTGAASREHGSWLDRLAGLSDRSLSGQTGALNNMANLATGTATQKVGLATDVTNGFLGANNQDAEGQEANKKGIASLGSNLIGLAGKAMGWGGF